MHPESLNIVITGGQAPERETRNAFFVSVSRDRGDTWERFGLSDTIAGWCHAMVVAPSATDIIFAAGRVGGSGAVYRSPDLGRTWERTASAPPGTVRSLAVHPHDPARLYAAAGRLYHSTDAGETWAGCDAGIGLVAVRFHPDFPDTIAAGGDSGVVVSCDGGESWLDMNDGLECRDVAWLEFADGGAKLLAATYGRSCFAWSVPTGKAEAVGSFGQRPGLEVFPSPGRGPVTLRIPAAGRCQIQVLDCTGRVVWNHRFERVSDLPTLELPDLPAGVYRLEMRGGERHLVARLVRL